MTALSMTASQVLPDADATFESGPAGEAITQGQLVYKDSADGKFKLADANGNGTTSIYGVAVSAAGANGQHVTVQTGGYVTLGAGAAPTAGVIYVAGATAGAIYPAADLSSGWTVSIFGVGASSNRVRILIRNSGIAV